MRQLVEIDMYERIIEIIVFVITELKHNKKINEIDLLELQKRGYTNSEISTAFSWIVDRYELSDKLNLTDTYIGSESFRILNEVEQELFTTEAWGEIIQYHSLGLLTNEHIEALIEKALITGMRELDSNRLKQFMASVIFNTQLNIYPGARFMLSGNDTVN